MGCWQTEECVWSNSPRSQVEQSPCHRVINRDGMFHPRNMGHFVSLLVMLTDHSVAHCLFPFVISEFSLGIKVETM